MQLVAPSGSPGRAAQQAAGGGGQQAAAVSVSQQTEGDAGLHTATGQLTCRRAVSKKLVFYDLLCSGPAQQEMTWWEVVLKLGTYSSSLEELADVRSRLKLGDVVRVQGRRSGSRELQATAIGVVRAWRDSHPGHTFRPRPSPLHGAAASGRPQQPQQQQAMQAKQAQQRTLESAAAGMSLPDLAYPTDPAVVALAAGAVAAAAAATPTRTKAGLSGLERASAAAAPAAPLCKFFVNTGLCAKGEACRFAHVHTGALRQQWVQDMRSERRLLSSWHGFAHIGGAAAKRRRAQILAAWLVQMYGKEMLNSGEGVLDVAGGAGGTTFELRHVHGIRCTLVDPRPLKLNKPQLRQLQAAGRSSCVCTLTAAQLQQGEDAAAGTRVAALLAPGPNPAALEASATASEGAAAAPLDFLQVRELFVPELWRSPGWRSRFSRRFSLVLACHPDQATEPALEYALEEDLPFAIVPCCVFPRLFAHRRLQRGADAACDGSTGSHSSATGSSSGGSSEGVPVLTYNDLVEYLAARGQARQAVLGFEGANIVVFRGAANAAASGAACASAVA